MSLPYDPEGSNPLNLKTETKSLSDVPNKERVLVPTYAPFFKKDLLVTTIDDRPLILGYDYYLAFHYKKGSEATRQSIFGGIALINPEIESVKFKRYQSLGGDSLVSPTIVAKYLVDPEMPPSLSTDWQDILARDVIVEPINPPESLEEALEVDPVLKSIKYVTECIKEGSEASSATLEELVVEVDNLYERFYGSGILNHIESTGHYAHAPTADDLGAAKRIDTAPDVAFLHTRNLESVINGIRNLCFGDAQLDKLASRDDSTILGVLSLAIGKKIVVGDNLTIDTTGGFSIKNSDGPFTIDVTTNVDGRGIFKAVTEKKSVSVSATKSSFSINGKPILSKSRAFEYINPNLGEVINVFTESSENVILQGDGVAGNPIRASVTIPTATLSEVGKFKAKDDNTESSVATAGRLFFGWREVNALAQDDLLINGKRFFNGFELDAADFGLGDINNTEASRKSLNLPFVKALSDKSRVRHGHTINDINGIVSGAPKVKGFSKYGEDGLAYYNDIYNSYIKLVGMDGLLDGYLPGDFIEGYYFNGLEIREVNDQSTGNHTTIISDFEMVEGRTVTLIEGGEFLNHEGTISVINGELSTASDGRVICIRKGGTIYTLPRYNYNLTRKWLEHTLDPEAHREAVTKGYFTLVENKPLQHIYNSPRESFLKDWTAHSHSTITNDQPAKPTEVNNWIDTYPRSLSVNNSVSYVYRVSPPVESYEVETLVTFDPLDVNTRGEVAVVLAGWKTPVEKNLTLVFSNRKDVPFATLWSNYNSPDQLKIKELGNVPGIDYWFKYAIHVRATLKGNVLTYAYALIENPTNNNLVKEIPYLDLEYVQGELNTRPYSSTLPVGYGFGVKGVKGARFERLYEHTSADVDNYASHQLLKAAYDKLTPQPLLGESTTSITFDEIEMGLWGASVLGNNLQDLSTVLTFPYELKRNSDGETTLFTLRAIFKDSNGESLYEPPKGQLILDFSKVILL